VATPSETFFSIDVTDMQRATAFYVKALAADVKIASPGWTSLYIAGVRVALALNPAHVAGRVGLHFVVGDITDARADVERAGGQSAAPAIEVAPGVIIADAVDSEGNTFTLSQR
jgi:predicted enzyme related to lactoylglutathione lyase